MIQYDLTPSSPVNLSLLREEAKQLPQQPWEVNQLTTGKIRISFSEPCSVSLAEIEALLATHDHTGQSEEQAEKALVDQAHATLSTTDFVALRTANPTLEPLINAVEALAIVATSPQA